MRHAGGWTRLEGNMIDGEEGWRGMRNKQTPHDYTSTAQIKNRLAYIVKGLMRKRSTDARIWPGKRGNRHVGHTRRDDVAQTSPMEELAHDLLATDNRSCGSLGPTTGCSSSTASRHADRGERHAHIVARHGRFQCAEGGISAVARPTVCLVCAQGCPIKALGSQNFR